MSVAYMYQLKDRLSEWIKNPTQQYAIKKTKPTLNMLTNVNVHYHTNTQESYINFSQSKRQSKESYM